MSVFVQLTGPKHCDFFVIPRRETAANPCIWVKCKSVFPPLSVSHLLLISTDQFYPLAPTRVPSFSIYLHQIWSGFPNSHTSWNTQFFPLLLTSSFFGLVHRPPVYLSLFLLLPWSYGKEGRLRHSPAGRQQSVHLTLLEQKETSCWWVVSFPPQVVLITLSWTLKLSLVFSSSALRGFRGVPILFTGSLSGLLFSVTTLWQWHVSLGCHVNIWLCCGGWGQMSFQPENVIFAF